jgi:hypothetical protein
MKVNQVCSNKGPDPLQRVLRYNHINVVGSFKNLLLQDHWVNSNQTWHKSSLGVGKGITLLQWEIIVKE